MNKLLLTLLCILGASNLYAATPGVYVGAGLGESRLDTPNSPNLLSGFSSYTHSQSRTGLGEKIFAGYNFNPYFGTELGVANYAQSKYDAQNNLGNAGWKYNLAAIDLVAKGYLPMSDTGINLYGLGGVALVHNTNKSTGTGIFATTNTDSRTRNQLRPMYGIGVSYDNKTQFTPSLEYTHIQGTGNLNADDGIPNADMISFNLAYKFN